MRDLFGSTSFIEFEVLETILGSSDAVKKILDEKDSAYKLEDYISNIDSYLYGISIIAPKDIEEVKLWISNYIDNLYIPLIKRDSLYIVKSRLIKEILSDSSRMDTRVREYVDDIIYDKVKSIIDDNKEILQTKLANVRNDKNLSFYLDNYYNIYERVRN